MNAAQPAVIGSDTFRKVMGHFVTGVTVVTALDGERPFGITVNALSSVSLDPPLVMVALDRRRFLTPIVRTAGRYAVNILSETFLRLIEAVRRGKTPDQPRAWLYRVAANLVVDGGRHRTVVGRVLGRLVDHRTEPPPEDEYLRGEMRREVRAALDELSIDARTALLLSAHGFSGREVASALHRTELATRSLICRARLRLRERLEGTEVSL